MITGISIENFKGIRERVAIELRPITLLFGANSAGKSSILHALHYAVEIFERHNPDASETFSGGRFVDLAGFANFVHGHSLDRVVCLQIELTNDQGLWSALDEDLGMEEVSDYLNLASLNSYATSFCVAENASVQIGVGWSRQRNEPHFAFYRLILEGQELAEIRSEVDSGRTYLSSLTLDHPALITFDRWDSRGDDDATPIEELFENPHESCLSACLRDAAFCFNRIQGKAPQQSDRAFAPMLFQGQTSAIPLSGEQFEFAILDYSDVFPTDKRGEEGQFSEEARGRSYREEEQRKIYEVAKATARGLSRILTAPIDRIRAHLQQFRYLGPIRELPPRNYRPPKSATTTLIDRRAEWPSGLGAWDALFRNERHLTDAVNGWLADRDRLDTGYRIHRKQFKELDLSDPLVIRLINGRAFDDVDDGRVSLDSLKSASRLVVVPESSEVELQPHDVGIGISQVVPVIVTALDGRERLLAIEQPELHIHPRIQAEIADLFVEASQKNQHRFLIETHSEHLILRLLRRIRETEKGTVEAHRQLRTHDLAVYYVRMEDGCSTVSRIDVDVNGEFIQPWPDDFFEIDFFERFPDAR